MNVTYVFPTVFGTDILDIDASVLDRLDDYKTKIHNHTYMSSDLRILELPDTKLIKERLTKIVNDFFYKLGYTKNKFVITTSWLSKLDRGGRILQHVHQNSFYSGCLYFQKDYSQAIPLEYINPKLYTAQIVPECEQPIHGTCGFTIPLEHNLLTLFPSQINHATGIHEGPPRKSLAFNIMPAGFVGNGGDSVYDTQWLNF